MNYVVADGLGTPRAIVDGTSIVQWLWPYQGNAFGEKQPTAAQGYTFNLRFPGQYYDAETGTTDNINRTYEPITGRYVQSDPLGLPGGLGTFVYVNNNPLSDVDPFGLKPGDRYRTVDAAGIAAVEDINPTSIKENREYAGVIYQNFDGSYSYTLPMPGTSHTSNSGDAPILNKLVGDYHTHAACDPDFDNENFSPSDTIKNSEKNVPGYLGTPSGAIKKYTPPRLRASAGDPVTVLKQGDSCLCR